MSVSNLLLAVENLRTQQSLTGSSAKVLPKSDTFLPSKWQGKIPQLGPFIDLNGIQWSASRSSSGAIARDRGQGAANVANVSPGAFEIIKSIDAASAKMAAAMQSGDLLNVFVMFLKAGSVVKGRETPDLPYYGYVFQNALVTRHETVFSPGELFATERIQFSYPSTEIWYTPQKDDGQPGPQVQVSMNFQMSA
jgi:type VI protein secretion system component Hcp